MRTAFALALTFSTAALAAELPCKASFVPAGTTTDGSGYTAIEVGLDGTVYVGTSMYGGYGWLIGMDPATLATRKIVDMQTLTGERLTGINTQGKIHAKIVIGPDGKIYFGSKQAHEIFGTRPEYGEAPDGYPGGHLCVYDPKTSVSKSLGILLKQEGLMGGSIDPVRGRLYFLSFPRDHFLSYDLKTGAIRDHGRHGAHSRYTVITPAGVVYTSGRDNTITRFDPEKDRLENLPVRVVGEGTYKDPYVFVMAPDGKRMWGLIAGHEHIMEFDLAGASDHIPVRNVARAAPAGLPNNDVHAAVLGKDGRVYYPLQTRPTGKRVDIEIHIMRFDPATRAVVDLGIPTPTNVDDARDSHLYMRKGQDKYKIDYMQGAAVGPDGTLYLLDIYPQLNVVTFPKLTAPQQGAGVRGQGSGNAASETRRRGDTETPAASGRRQPADSAPGATGGSGQRPLSASAEGKNGAPVQLAAAQAPAKADAKPAKQRDPISDLSTLSAWTLHNVILTAEGHLALAPSELISDENGSTTIRNQESLSANVWAKKLLHVPVPDAAAKPKSAQLYVFGSAKNVRFNGTALKPGTLYLTTGWSEVEVPVDLIKDGANEIVLSGGGSLIIENCKHPNRSAKSRDAGRTWDFDHLGDDDFNDGEYLIRLRLERTPAEGWAMSPAIPLGAGVRQLHTPGARIDPLWTFIPDLPVSARSLYRFGNSTRPDEAGWTKFAENPSWRAVNESFAQLRVEWTAKTARAVLAGVTVLPTAPAAGFTLTHSDRTAAFRPSSPMPFEKTGPRLAELRKKHNLDAAIAGAKDEFDALVKLRHHVRNKWDNGWEVSNGGYVAPWDVRQILTGQPHAECLTMCTHYSVTFAQFAQALGWNARPVVLDHHCVAEVWVDQFGKWVLMDTGNSKKDKGANFHMSKDGVPLSCLDIHRVWLSGKTDGVTVHFGDGRTDALANLKKYPVCQLENWRRFGVPRRNNLLTTPFPGELEQGWSQYFGDFYTWWEDAPESGVPWPKWSREYSHQSCREGDLYPTLNTTTMHPFADGESGMLVHLDTQTPNFKTFQVKYAAGEAWKDCGSTLKLTLKAGDNVVFARAVNQFGRTGRESQLTVKK